MNRSWLLLPAVLCGCGSDYVGVEPKDGFRTDVVVRDHEHTEAPAVLVPSTTRDDRSDSVQEIVFPDDLMSGTMLAFEGELIGPEEDTSPVGVSFGPSSDEQYPQDGTSVPHATSNRYRVEVQLPSDPGRYVVQVFTRLIPEDFKVGVDDPATLELETRIIAQGELTIAPRTDVTAD
jgi:hypothetical protein